MIKKFSEIELNQETIDLILKTKQSDAGLSKKIHSPKYLIVDWKGTKLSDVDLSKLDEEAIMTIFMDDIESINSPELLLSVFKKCETENEEILWNRLVDDHIISDELYQKNTYEENFAILMKVTKFKL